jgi:hypothetical protein
VVVALCCSGHRNQEHHTKKTIHVHVGSYWDYIQEDLEFTAHHFAYLKGLKSEASSSERIIFQKLVLDRQEQI